MRRAIVVLGVVVMLLLVGLALGPDGLKLAATNLAYLAIGLVAAWAILGLANYYKITGEHFDVGEWLDIIVGSRPAPWFLDDRQPKTGYECSRVAMAIVLAGVFIAVAVVVSPFIRP